ncbi:serine/threonine-protein kinase haspin-like [Haemaphysalis longicornis]
MTGVRCSKQYPHSCRKCYSECLNKLVKLCDAQEVMAFNQVLKDSFQGTKLKKMTETVDSEAYIVTEGHKTPTPVDTVVQLYSIDTHSASRVYYNLFACKKLSELRSGLQNRCYGFRLVRRLSFVQDALPENFSRAYDEFIIAHTRSCHPHPYMRPKDQRYIVMESDYAGTSILHCRIKPSQAVSIIGQVACTLAVAERELEFEHRNLNEENIIVLPSTSKNQHFLIDGRTCCVKGSGLKVTLFDDYLSRMTVHNQVIMRMRNYNCVYKEKTAIYLTMERIIKDRWDVFHPETNARWLAYLCGHLSDYLTVPNPTGDWQRKLELLALMQRDLHRFRSADEFVWKYINKIGHIHTGHDYQPHRWGSDRPVGLPFLSTIRNILRLRGRDPKSDGPSSLGTPAVEDSAERPRGRDA